MLYDGVDQQCEVALSAHLVESSELFCPQFQQLRFELHHCAFHTTEGTSSSQHRPILHILAGTELSENTTDIHWNHISLLHFGASLFCHLVCQYGFRLPTSCNPDKIRYCCSLENQCTADFKSRPLGVPEVEERLRDHKNAEFRCDANLRFSCS